MVFRLADKEIKIVNVSSGKVLEAPESGDRSMVGQSWNGGHGFIYQQWRLIPVPGANHQYQIENVGSRMALGVEGESTENGARVCLCEYQDGRHKKITWRLIPVDNDEYVIVNTNSGKVIDLWGAGVGDDTLIAQFDYWNGPQQRWKLVTADPVVNTRAVITITRNENVFLPIWLRYYSQFFNAEDIYVLDHQSVDGSTDCGGFNKIPVSQPVFGDEWQRDLVQHHQHELVDQYDVVLYTDVDEIIAPDPRYCNLGQYIDRFDQDFVTCKGYEIIHLKEHEQPFDSTKPVLTQRSTWYHNPMYSKTLLARVPMLWHPGFHARIDGEENSDPNLYLIHLHRMDYDICFARHQERARFPRAENDVKANWSHLNWYMLTDSNEYADVYYNNSCGGGPVHFETLPPFWRTIV